jgi:transcriptional regulator with XRE-family HTH domain
MSERHDYRVTDSTERFGAAPESDGRSLRDVRAERLLSLRELARLAGVAPSTIYKIELGRSTPHLSVVRRIAVALNVDAATVTEFRRAIRARGGLR